MEAGKEGMKFEAGAFSYYGVMALTASPGTSSYVPLLECAPAQACSSCDCGRRRLRRASPRRVRVHPWGWCKPYVLASETGCLPQCPWEGARLVATLALTPKPGGWQRFASSQRMRVLAFASDVFGTGGQLCSLARGRVTGIELTGINN